MIQAATLLLCVAVSATAGGAPHRTPQAFLHSAPPRAFLGVSLGVPIYESMPECGEDVPDSVTCFTRIGDGFVVRQNPPDIGIAGTLVIMPDEDALVESVTYSFDRADFATMRSLLIRRFGRPLQENAVTFQNGFGATYVGKRVMWFWADMTGVMLEDHGTDLEKCTVMATAPRMMKRDERARKKVEKNWRKL